MIEAGHDPRRFVTDLLERFRDLIVLHNVPNAADLGLIDAPEDQVAREVAQAERFGPAELTRAADVTSAALSELRGATAPRLHLELMAARLLLPAADADEAGTRARLDQLERRMAAAPVHAAAPAARGPRGHRRGCRARGQPASATAVRAPAPPKRLSEVAPSTRPLPPSPEAPARAVEASRAPRAAAAAPREPPRTSRARERTRALRPPPHPPLHPRLRRRRADPECRDSTSSSPCGRPSSRRSRATRGWPG